VEEADDVMLKKRQSQEDSGNDLSDLDKMIVWSRNKPLSKDELEALCPQQKKADVGLTVRPWATVKMVNPSGDKQRPVVFVGIQGTF
jgi:hypothetical protein